MTPSEPYLVLRDFRVYFSKRRGFLDALRRSDPGHVRAVDGVDMEIRKGEVYCLVGESGCGKTTTGKGILRLVEPSGGDVLLQMPPEDIHRYDEARGSGDLESLDGLRRRWSLNYREAVVWRLADILFFLFAATCASLLAAALAAILVVATESVASPLLTPLAFIPLGIVLAFVATRPPVKLARRLGQLLLPFAGAGTVVAVLVATAFQNALAGLETGLGRVVGIYLARGDLYILGVLPLQLLFAVTATYTVTGAFVRRRELASGFEADRIRRLRKSLQIIFQDPYEYLNPKHSVYDIVSEPLIVNRLATTRAETQSRVRKALDDAGLRPPEDFLYRYPHELSGGQRQRVSIASALVLEPDFLVADEPVSMLDVSIRTEIIELLLQLRKERGLTYLFITHDLSLAWVLADRIGVMYLGKIVEEGPTREVIKNPQHPYTKALISVVPIPNPRRRRERIILRGERPDPGNIPPGCRFHPRCPVAFERCGWTSGELAEELRALAAEDGPRAAVLRSMRMEGPRTLVLPGSPEGTEAWLRDQAGTKSETYRALKAIQGMERTASGLRVHLHPADEPPLRTVAPGVRVACHLVI